MEISRKIGRILTVYRINTLLYMLMNHNFKKDLALLFKGMFFEERLDRDSYIQFLPPWIRKSYGRGNLEVTKSLISSMISPISRIESPKMSQRN